MLRKDLEVGKEITFLKTVKNNGGDVFERGSKATITHIFENIDSVEAINETNDKILIDFNKLGNANMAKVEVGDVIRIRGDLTVDEINKQETNNRMVLMWALAANKNFTVGKVKKYFVVTEGICLYLKHDFVEIVKKAPKLYFDARKLSEGANLTDLWAVKNHGKTKKEISNGHTYSDKYFVKEKPKPLEVIGGVVL